MWSHVNGHPTMRKVALRLVPFLCLIYVVAFIDRIKFGFAAITMSKDLGLTPVMFGLRGYTKGTVQYSQRKFSEDHTNFDAICGSTMRC
jgi:hypothetical protein